jgi:hypothetical protein
MLADYFVVEEAVIWQDSDFIDILIQNYNIKNVHYSWNVLCV